jgi:hypothetical protein
LHTAGARARLLCAAGDGAPLVAPLEGGERTDSPTPPIDTAMPPCPTGSTTTAGKDDHTTHSETGSRSAAFTTSLGKDN